VAIAPACCTPWVIWVIGFVVTQMTHRRQRWRAHGHRVMGHLGHRFSVDPNDPWPNDARRTGSGLWVIWVIWVIGFQSLAVDAW